MPVCRDAPATELVPGHTADAFPVYAEPDAFVKCYAEPRLGPAPVEPQFDTLYRACYNLKVPLGGIGQGRWRWIGQP
jgi:hypothetical protein